MRRLIHPRPGRPHSLAGELIVSLTSYPARFPTLHLTLACLLDQTVKPDRTILWIADGDFGKLSLDVRELENRGLEIRACDDLRSYKKLVPALEAFPDAFIATADDDTYYPADWLEKLVIGAADRAIVSHRVHRVKRNVDGTLRPYSEWTNDVHDASARKPSANLMPTGVGGTLYPPRCMDPRVTDRGLFQRLCPTGDDLWFYWCARLAGTPCRKVGSKMRIVSWAGTQDSALWDNNEAGENDRMIHALEAEFGVDA